VLRLHRCLDIFAGGRPRLGWPKKADTRASRWDVIRYALSAAGGRGIPTRNQVTVLASSSKKLKRRQGLFHGILLDGRRKRSKRNWLVCVFARESESLLSVPSRWLVKWRWMGANAVLVVTRGRGREGFRGWGVRRCFLACSSGRRSGADPVAALRPHRFGEGLLATTFIRRGRQRASSWRSHDDDGIMQAKCDFERRENFLGLSRLLECQLTSSLPCETDAEALATCPSPKPGCPHRPFWSSLILTAAHSPGDPNSSPHNGFTQTLQLLHRTGQKFKRAGRDLG
jgi:hypothetical protein